MSFNRKLRADHLKNPNIVDARGRTLWQVAVSMGNRRALNFFRDGLVAGPSCSGKTPTQARYTPPYVSPFGDHGRVPCETRSPIPPVSPCPRTSEDLTAEAVYDFSFPTFSGILPCQRWSEFPAQLARQGKLGILNKVVPGLCFSVQPEFPPGLRIDSNSGPFVAVPQQSARSRCSKSVQSFQLQGGASMSSALCSFQ